MTTSNAFYANLQNELQLIKESGLFKSERVITTPQSAYIQTTTATGSKLQVINLCANNYLGLSSHPAVIKAAHEALDTHGFGLSSVRFICGTQDIHKELESRLSQFLGTQDTILYAAAFDANGGLFEPLFTEEDAVISDELNHASIIDGIRLCKARRFRFANNDMDDLQRQLQAARDGGARFILVVTDGVFSMDGSFANLGDLARLAADYGALTMVDDCHATGFIGPQGRGTAARALSKMERTASFPAR